MLHGILAGALGALAGTPAELVLVRLMGDGTQGRCCPKMPVRYCGLVDGLKKVAACDGNLGLWRGGALSALRSAIISSSLVYAYSKSRQRQDEENINKVKNKKDAKIKPVSKTGGIIYHLATAMITSLYISFLTLPIDLLKTWYQYLPADPCCRQPYILQSLIRCRSMLFLWKGFIPYYLRMCTHTFITFLLLDNLSSLYESGALNPFHRPPGPPKKWTPWD